MKKLITLLTITVMAFMSVTGVYAKNIFTDVEEGRWYYNSVIQASNDGIMLGTSATTFEPDTVVTREMFVTALVRLSIIGQEEIDNYKDFKLHFTDYDQNKWYSASVAWATEHGIVKGVSDSEFGIGQPVTREQIATLLSRYLDTYFIVLPLAKSPTEAFADTPAKWAEKAVDKMRVYGIFAGDEKGNFNPKATATRAEVATILCRLNQAHKESALSFNIEKDGVSMVRIRNNTVLDNSGNPKTLYVTTKTDIEKAVDFINDAPISNVNYIGDTDENDYEITIYNTQNEVIFNAFILFGGSILKISHCYYSFETEYFKPVLENII